jgi:hypothetical protein
MPDVSARDCSGFVPGLRGILRGLSQLCCAVLCCVSGFPATLVLDALDLEQIGKLEWCLQARIHYTPTTYPQQVPSCNYHAIQIPTSNLRLPWHNVATLYAR